VTGLPSVMRILVYFNLYGIFICYNILFVVRDVENVEDSTQTSALQIPAPEVPSKQEDEEDIEPLRSAMWWNGKACEGVNLDDDNDDKFNHQSTHRYVKLPIPTVNKGKWYYPNRNKFVSRFLSFFSENVFRFWIVTTSNMYIVDFGNVTMCTLLTGDNI
jgi:hypothetical protein